MSSETHIFLWKMPYLVEQEVMPLLSELPLSEKSQVAKITRDRRHIEFVCGRYLLRKVVSDKFRLKLPDQFAMKNRKPCVADAPSFNLSHSKKFVSFAISDHCDIGLDIEIEDDKRDILKIADSYGSEGEVSMLNNLASASRTSAFYKLWSLKESFAKATGDGLDLNLKNLKFNFDRSEIVETPKSQKCVIFHSRKDDLHLSVSILAEDASTPSLWEVEKSPEGFRYKKLENVHFEKFKERCSPL